MNLCRFFSRLVMTVCMLAIAVPASAADSSSAGEWAFDAGIYAWTPSMNATPDGGDSVHMSFNEILDNLDMTFMGVFNARKDKWSLLADVIYLKLSDDVSGVRQLPGIPVPVTGKVDVEMESWIVTVAGGYNLVDTGKYSMDLLGGARYLSIDIPLKAQVGLFQSKTTSSGKIWDGIIGVRGRAELTDNWYLNYYLDGGAGQKSSTTWQGLAGLGYQFKKFDALAGYRYLTYDMDSGELDDLTVKGPFFGVRFMF